MSARTLSKSLSMMAVLCALAGVLLVAQHSRGEEKEKLTAEERIEQALDESTTFEFEETSLQNVVVFLSEAHDIPIVLDRRALNDEGLDPETAITYRLKQVKLRSALKLLLRDVELTFTIHDEVLEITTTCAAQERMETRVYAVTELVENCAEKLESLADVFTACIAPESWDEVGGEGSLRPLMLNGKSVLVISQTREVHNEIEALLDQLRAVDNR